MVYPVYPTLKKRKVRIGVYDVLNEDGRVIANIAKTGTHLDDYPWSWYFTVDVHESVRSQGSEESLKVALDEVSAKWYQNGLRDTL